jgi:hypothetical protein
LAGGAATLLGRARPATLAFEMLLGIAAFAALARAALTFDDRTLFAPATFAALLLGITLATREPALLLGITFAATSALGAALLLGIRPAERDAALLLGVTRAAALAFCETLLLGTARDAALLLGI